MVNTPPEREPTAATLLGDAYSEVRLLAGLGFVPPGDDIAEQVLWTRDLALRSGLGPDYVEVVVQGACPSPEWAKRQQELSRQLWRVGLPALAAQRTSNTRPDSQSPTRRMTPADVMLRGHFCVAEEDCAGEAPSLNTEAVGVLVGALNQAYKSCLGRQDPRIFANQGGQLIDSADVTADFVVHLSGLLSGLPMRDDQPQHAGAISDRMVRILEHSGSFDAERDGRFLRSIGFVLGDLLARSGYSPAAPSRSHLADSAPSVVGNGRRALRMAPTRLRADSPSAASARPAGSSAANAAGAVGLRWLKSPDPTTRIRDVRWSRENGKQ